MPERVHISIGYDFIQPFPLDAHESGRIFIGFGVFQINFIVGRIVIPADHQASARVPQRVGVGKKIPVKIQLVGQPVITIPPLGKYTLNKIKSPKSISMTRPSAS